MPRSGKRGARGGGRSTRLKTAKGRKLSSSRWLGRQLKDPYVAEARAKGYRSRAAFKL
ncbi:MAG: rRNA methyltransferase, partial [Alphaproteobacteria bacterium]|nr:rRNA methyltransferase [Alphaproteobacteria bacterium]